MSAPDPTRDRVRCRNRAGRAGRRRRIAMLRPGFDRLEERLVLSIKKDKRIFLAAQHDASIDDPRPDDIYTMGCVANVVQSLKLPDGNIKVLVEGIERGKILGFACHDATCRNFFGPTGVEAAARNKGIGAALLLACLEDMRQAGYGYAIIGGVGPAEFYTKTVGAVAIEGSEPGIYRGLL